MQPLERDSSHRHGISSFFDWNRALSKPHTESAGTAADNAAPKQQEPPSSNPVSPVHRLVQKMSLEAESSSSEESGVLHLLGATWHGFVPPRAGFCGMREGGGRIAEGDNQWKPRNRLLLRVSLQ